MHIHPYYTTQALSEHREAGRYMEVLSNHAFVGIEKMKMFEAVIMFLNRYQI